MHKGYTLNYFIEFFSDIPSHRWTTEQLQVGETVQKCALGHSLTNQRTGEIEADNARTDALVEFLHNSVADINDGNLNCDRALGKTPRTRILRALRNRKKFGSPYGKQSF